MSGQFLTAVFELRPSNRKAAALERVRKASEDAFWTTLARSQAAADAIAAAPDKKERSSALSGLMASIAKGVVASGSRDVLNEPVIQGVVRDIGQAISSYVGLKAGGHPAEWPQRGQAYTADLPGALDSLSAAISVNEEVSARDLVSKVSRGTPIRPFTLARKRDGLIVRDGSFGRLAVILNILPVTKATERTTVIKAGFDASSGEAFRAAKSKAKIAIPLACSKWHEQKFLSGNADLKSCLIIREDDRWFMAAQFEMRERKVKMTGNRLGVDRGIVNPVSLAVVSRDGAVVRVSEPMGKEVGDAIRKADAKRKAEQKRRGVTSHKHVNRVNNLLHEMANEIVREAKIHGAEVVFEKLSGLKSAITVKRAHGARKNPWQKSLKKAQLGKLEQIVTYKLKLAGLPVPTEVVPGGTSQTCPACGHCEPKNRTTQAEFACLSCNFTQHADKVAPVNIGRRAIVLKDIKRGDKLAPREREIVERLRARNDCGLGPLAVAYSGANGLVADRAAVTRYEGARLSVPEPSAGRNVSLCHLKPSRTVFAERSGAVSGHSKRRKGSLDQQVGQERLL